MGTAAVILQTLVLVRTRRFVLGQDHARRAETGRPAVFILTEMRASSVINGACVYLDARFAVVLQQLVIIRTRALDATFRVRAKMRAIPVILNTFVDILARPAVLADTISCRTGALESAISIRATVGARIIVQLGAFVHVLASSAVVLQLVSFRATATNLVVVLLAHMRTTIILGAKSLRRLTDAGVLLQVPAGRTLATVRAVGVNANVGTIMLALALINIYASTLPLRITVSRDTNATIAFLRLCAFVFRDTCAIIFSELKFCRTGT